MAFKDLREFIARLETAGEVQRIEEEVDWDLEAGAMLRRSYEENLPVPFFQKVKDYPDGYRLIGGAVSNYRRIAIALGMPPKTHPKELQEEYLRRKQHPVKPTLVNDGPCKENVRIGDEVDLLKFPVPMIHEGDGGRYIGTWHLTVSRALDKKWVNWGMYRHQLHDKSTLGILQAGTAQHLGLMYQAYEDANKTMDVAIAIGVDPILTLCAASPVPYGVSEVEVAGAMRGEPVALVKCETVNLAVPAAAEIVIEGEIRPHERMDEGPFGEYTGYMAGAVEPRPVIHVKAVTYRNDPILTFCCQGTPVTESAMLAITGGAGILEALRTRGIPVTAVCIPPEASNSLTVVAVRNLYPGIADDVAHVVWSTKRASLTPYLVIVEDDVDPFDTAEVLHALVMKCHPYKGIVRLERTPTVPLLPFLDPQERKQALGGKVYFNCMWPLDWKPSEVPRRASFDKIYPAEIQRKALAKWRKYGY
ncbi:MAG: UbiD family decarboxylase [Chloroflexi bacterium]|nr:UbiD family decarboxylase [Chloroflexota bacterium]